MLEHGAEVSLKAENFLFDKKFSAQYFEPYLLSLSSQAYLIDKSQTQPHVAVKILCTDLA